MLSVIFSLMREIYMLGGRAGEKYQDSSIKYQVSSINFSSINFISIKHYIKIHQDKKKDIYTTKSYGGVGWKANEA